ncbi:hypothetical protein CYMTET_34544 [Cymbomonas tetramitiformis]|uniref:Uncharacterized protein n=1 Tax=Cymbomonas tetramitiformis TaxID=36881 RepID=A0AAE0FAX4_9CHLO|nr:hypothetical protein CYMTET_34544 [Cymbomonas tetramitiformis]
MFSSEASYTVWSLGRSTGPVRLSHEVSGRQRNFNLQAMTRMQNSPLCARCRASPGARPPRRKIETGVLFVTLNWQKGWNYYHTVCNHLLRVVQALPELLANPSAVLLYPRHGLLAGAPQVRSSPLPGSFIRAKDDWWFDSWRPVVAGAERIPKCCPSTQPTAADPLHPLPAGTSGACLAQLHAGNTPRPPLLLLALPSYMQATPRAPVLLLALPSYMQATPRAPLLLLALPRAWEASRSVCRKLDWLPCALIGGVGVTTRRSSRMNS